MYSNPKFYKTVTNATAKLVQTLTDFGEGSENYEACVEYALSHFQNHRFLGADSHKIERTIKGLCEKCIIHSQPEKAEILKKLTSSFLESDVTNASVSLRDGSFAILSVLLNLSESPVNSEYVEPVKKAVVEEEDTFDWTQYLLEGEELLHPTQWAWDDTPGTSEDDSDDESSDKEDDDKGKVRVGALPHKTEANDGGKIWKSCQKLVAPYWENMNTRMDTIFLNDSTETFNFPVSSNLNEVDIIREILWLLAGHTNLYIFPVQEGRHMVCSDLNLTHATMKSLVSLLKGVAKYGDIVQCLRKIIFSKPCIHSQTCQAFSESLLKYTEQFQKELMAIEKRVIENQTTQLLGDILKELRPRFEELSAIQDLCEKSILLDNPTESSARVVLRLLGKIHDAILDQSHSSSLCGEKNSLPRERMLLIWIDSVRPYIDMIDNWVTQGRLNDPYNEFVIKRTDSNINAKSSLFWTAAFSMAVSDSPAYLAWLQPVLHHVTMAGKSMEILETLGSKFTIEQNATLYKSFIKSIIYKHEDDRDSSKEMISSPSFKCDPLLRLNFQRLFHSNTVTENPQDAQLKVDDQYSLPVIIQKSINCLIIDKCQIANKMLLDFFLNRCDLKSVLEKFHQFHLMGWGDVMYDFSVSVFKKISSGEYWEDLMSLRAAMQEAISESNPNTALTAIAVVLNNSKRGVPGANLLINSTDVLELFFTVEWPLTIVVTEKCVSDYNRIFSYLFQVKHALFCLENLKFDAIYSRNSCKTDKGKNITGINEAQKAHRLFLLRAKLLCLISHWHNFIMTTVILAEKQSLFAKLDEANNLDEIISAHDTFLNRVQMLCLLKEEKQAGKMMQGALRKMFNLCIVLHRKWNRGVDFISHETLTKHEADYKECSEFLGIILQNLLSRKAIPLSLETLAFCLMS